jgi:alpha-glucosidase
MTNPWWHGTIGYEIYPRSFADANGDGIGDLPGITQRLGHLAWLGIDAVWVAPFYESPGFDHGYDISDYRAIADHHGTLGDFDAFVARAHELNLRVIVDLVPNHSSSHHEWFKQAQQGKDNPFRDFYVWRDPAPDDGPPNNWLAHFGGSAWTLDEPSGQYYCHLFLPEQPDLNWENEEVRAAFDDILRFWCERGIDGFRIDVAHALVKDQAFPDLPTLRELPAGQHPQDYFDALDHRYDLNQPGTLDVYRRWQSVVSPYGVALVGEVGSATPDQLARYVEPGVLDTAFHLEPVWRGWEPEWLLEELAAVQERSPSSISWVINNHDRSRSVNRFGGGDLGRSRSLAVTALQFGLGGMPFLYQGEELGLEDGKVDAADLTDPVSTRNEGAVGRDAARTAMPWDATEQNGFTTAPKAWLPSEPRSSEETVAGQMEDSDSWLHRYRRLIAVRKTLPALWREPLDWMPATTSTAHSFVRGDVFVATNLGDESVSVLLPDGEWQLVYASSSIVELTPGAGVLLPEASTAYLRRTRQ